MNFFSLFKRKIIYKFKNKILIDHDKVDYKTLDDLFLFIRDQLPKTFNLEIVNLVTSNKSFSEKYSLIFKDEITIEKIYGKKNQLIMDAVDKELKIFDKSENKIYSNAIFFNLGVYCMVYN